MARYRKIDVRMRADEKFRALSKPPPNGQDCWIYLLTNRYTTNIPGVYAAFEETLARDLDWPLEGFRSAFAEVSASGMVKADWTAGLVFIPRAITYDPPQSLNVVKGWLDTWDELPECALKAEVWRSLRTFTEGMSDAFGKAFADAIREPSAKACAIPEPEPEQDPEPEPERANARARVDRRWLTGRWGQLGTNISVPHAGALDEACVLIERYAAVKGVDDVHALAERMVVAFVEGVIPSYSFGAAATSQLFVRKFEDVQAALEGVHLGRRDAKPANDPKLGQLDVYDNDDFAKEALRT